MFTYHKRGLYKYICRCFRDRHYSGSIRFRTTGLDTGKISLHLAPSRQRSVLGKILHTHTIWDKTAISQHGLVFITFPLGEAPLLGDVNLLSAGELKLGSSQSFNNVSLMLVMATHTQQNLSNLYSGNCAVGLAEGTSHSSLKPISSGAWQHFVDTQHVEGVNSHSDMELVLCTVLYQVLVATNTGGLHGLRTQLFQFIGYQMNGQGEVLNIGLLSSKIEDTNL